MIHKLNLEEAPKPKRKYKKYKFIRKRCHEVTGILNIASQAGMTNRQLADKLVIDPDIFELMVEGEMRPNFKQFARIRHYFDTLFTDLYRYPNGH